MNYRSLYQEETWKVDKTTVTNLRKPLKWG